MSRILKNYPNKITQEYKKGTHNGIDIVANINGKSGCDYLVAHSDGKVTKVVSNYNKTDKTGSSYGNYVIIQHDGYYYTLYAHMKYGSVKVKVGDNIKKGDVLGYIGNTGHSFGAHLHFEVRNEKGTKIDPTPYLENDLPTNPKSNWTTGTYKALVAKTIRTSCSLVTTNRVKVKECMASVKKQLTSTKPNDIAMFKVGAKVEITEVIEKDKRLWGKLKNSYIVIRNQDGTPQAQKID